MRPANPAVRGIVPAATVAPLMAALFWLRSALSCEFPFLKASAAAAELHCVCGAPAALMGAVPFVSVLPSPLVSASEPFVSSLSGNV